jgi:hypothetical protein
MERLAPKNPAPIGFWKAPIPLRDETRRFLRDGRHPQELRVLSGSSASSRK